MYGSKPVIKRYMDDTSGDDASEVFTLMVPQLNVIIIYAEML